MNSKRRGNIADDLHCRRCGEAMTLLSKLGDRYKLFQYLDCDLYEGG
jgi:hypothetical protein